jgi:hypothetical protein
MGKSLEIMNCYFAVTPECLYHHLADLYEVLQDVSIFMGHRSTPEKEDSTHSGVDLNYLARIEGGSRI